MITDQDADNKSAEEIFNGNETLRAGLSRKRHGGNRCHDGRTEEMDRLRSGMTSDNVKNIAAGKRDLLVVVPASQDEAA